MRMARIYYLTALLRLSKALRWADCAVLDHAEAVLEKARHGQG